MSTTDSTLAVTTPAVTTKPTKKPVSAKKTPELKRGLKKAEVIKAIDAFKFSTEPATLKQIVYAIGVDHWYVVAYVKKNSTIVGDAPKAKGARGKSAKLYKLNDNPTHL